MGRKISSSESLHTVQLKYVSIMVVITLVLWKVFLLLSLGITDPVPGTHRCACICDQ